MENSEKHKVICDRATSICRDDRGCVHAEEHYTNTGCPVNECNTGETGYLDVKCISIKEAKLCKENLFEF